MSVQHSADTVSATLARSRLGVWPLVFTVMAAAAPLTVVAGGATTGFAVTGITGIPIAYVLVALLLALFSVGYVAMSGRVLNAGAFYTYITHGLGKPLSADGQVHRLARQGAHRRGNPVRSARTCTRKS